MAHVVAPPPTATHPHPPRRSALCAALSLDHAARALAEALAAAEGGDADETWEGVMGPMNLALELIAESGPTGPDLLVCEHAMGLRTCALIGCTRLVGASEHDLPAQRCSGCSMMRYCCKEHQAKAWQRAHRGLCASLAALGGAGPSA